MDKPAAAGLRIPQVELGDQLHNVRLIVHVAEAQSIAGAAKQLFKTPSAVTRSIIELETALGIKLFERKPRGALLNSYGKVVFDRAARINGELDQAAADLPAGKARGAPASSSAVNSLLSNGRKLQLLIHLADTRNMSTAGAQMGLSQSGASMALSRIEAVIGQPLFQRGLHGMTPTEAANKLVMRAKRVFAEFRHMRSELDSLSGTVSGSVVIGALPLGRTYLFPMAIADVVKRYPKIHITTVESPFESLISSLRSGDVDAVVGVPRENMNIQALTIEPLFTDRLTLIARAGHPLAKMKQITPADLVGQQWILPWTSSPSRALLDAFFHSQNLPPPAPTVESADLGVLRQLISVTDMVAIASARQIMFELKSGQFVELPIALAGMTREVSLVLRGGAVLSPAAMACLDAIRAQVQIDPAKDNPAR